MHELTQEQSAPQIDSKAFVEKIFKTSPLKRAKFLAMKALMPDTANLICLDIGSDNGVIAVKLRELGGDWKSADLSQGAVDSISELTSQAATLLNPSSMQFDSDSFDFIAVVDLLEHVSDDKLCVKELERILKPGGALVVNVPNPKEGPWRRFRYMLGQTDQRHGHLRAGYSLDQLQALFGDGFRLSKSLSYNRIFSEIFDCAISFALDRKKDCEDEIKGRVVSLKSGAAKSSALRLLGPLFRLWCSLDKLLPFGHPSMITARFDRVS